MNSLGVTNQSPQLTTQRSNLIMYRTERQY